MSLTSRKNQSCWIMLSCIYGKDIFKNFKLYNDTLCLYLYICIYIYEVTKVFPSTKLDWAHFNSIFMFIKLSYLILDCLYLSVLMIIKN